MLLLPKLVGYFKRWFILEIALQDIQGYPHARGCIQINNKVKTMLERLVRSFPRDQRTLDYISAMTQAQIDSGCKQAERIAPSLPSGNWEQVSDVHNAVMDNLKYMGRLKGDYKRAFLYAWYTTAKCVRIIP